MPRETFRVTFQPEGRSVFALLGTKAVEAAGQAGIVLNTPCGGEGTCGKCKLEVRGAAPEPTDAERQRLTRDELANGVRLACQLAIDRDMVISVPEATRFFEQVVLTEGKERQYSFDPNVRKRYVEMPEPSVDDLRSDVDRLKDALCSGGDDLQVDLWLVRELSARLRAERFKVTAVLRGDEIECLESGDTTDSIWGVSFDIGTTTIVGDLVNLANGERAGVASRTNPQVHFGDDVVSRIRYSEEHAGGLNELHKRLMNCMNDIVLELVEGAGVNATDVYETTAVGNTTMTHILLGIDPSPIAHAPYVSVFREAQEVRASALGLDIHPNANLHVLPNIAGFVGSDTVGVILASGMMHSEEPRIAIDIGTNGEVVVGNRNRLIACSCAAGPAFEGARIRYGMRATEGAISKVVLNEEVEVSVIGGGRATGMCGSGLIDAVAELLRVGVIGESGRIAEPHTLPGTLPEGIRKAVVSCDGQPAVVLVAAHRSKMGEAILLTQRDVREVQLAKGAIWAGIQVVSSEFGLNPREVSQVLLAGGFGNFIRRSNAKRIGLLPDLPTSRIEFIGNAAAVGARMALKCRGCRAEAEMISRTTEYVELANRPDFQALFMDAMMFPGGGEGSEQ